MASSVSLGLTGAAAKPTWSQLSGAHPEDERDLASPTAVVNLALLHLIAQASAAESAGSAQGQGRLWPARRWHSRCTLSSGNSRAFQYLRFVPQHKVAALQPAARGQEPRDRKPAERTALA